MRAAAVSTGVLLLALAAFAAGAATRSAIGTWRKLPPAPAPAATSDATAAWTGKELIVFGRRQTNPPWSADVAAAYDPEHATWRALHPFPGPKGNYEGGYRAFWTGTAVLVLGPFDFQAYDPRTDVWRRLPLRAGASTTGITTWTGHELIVWGGGCCGDASSAGFAYDVGAGRWTKLPRSPLAPSQGPVGVWDGKNVIVLVSGRDPDGRPYPPGLARAAAFNPSNGSWTRIPPPPAARPGAVGIWTGNEVLLVGGSNGRTTARTGFAYDPIRRAWRTLPPSPIRNPGFAAVWGAGRLLVWGGAGNEVGAEYVTAAGRWFTLRPAPIRPRSDPAAVWTGTTLIVWGGRGATDGASFGLETVMHPAAGLAPTPRGASSRAAQDPR